MSVGNISTSDSHSAGADGGNMCLELALEGERLCKAGDCRAGVAFFQAAIQAGTDDLRTLSAIYSQLGNAFFYLGDYQKAMQYHEKDLKLARNMDDKLGEAKSSGNLGNTLKVMGKYDEAMVCCKRHLEISRQLNDKLSEGRALYNLGNVYHAKGKAIGKVGQQDPGEYPEEVKVCLQEAIKYYEQNLELMKEINDTAAQGRACGNLGNTYYLLGNFTQAIHYHQERLKIAREFGDKAAERRANSNLGNSHIFLGDYQTASEHYKRTLVLAQDLGDRAVEAQACYSLGNTYTLLRDYPTAIDYHLRHLIIAQQLMDRVGEGRACWSLGNAHAAMGNHEKALYFASKHLEISKQLGDPLGQVTAQMNVTDLRKVLGMSANDLSPDSLQLMDSYGNNGGGVPSPGVRRYNRVRRNSMEQLDLIKLTPENKGKITGSSHSSDLNKCDEEESFFELLSRYQSERMDDQRCSLSDNKENQHRLQNSKSVPPVYTMPAHTPGDEDLLDMIQGLQSKRMDEQRAALPHVGDRDREIPDDGFLDMLIRCQASRLEDQRSHLPQEGSTVPDEDFFSLISRLQSGRMEDQRATVPALRKT